MPEAHVLVPTFHCGAEVGRSVVGIKVLAAGCESSFNLKF